MTTDMLRDMDCRINGEGWAEVAQSQNGLFAEDRIQELGRIMASDFMHGRGECVPMHRIQIMDINAPISWGLSERVCGYDLPCLVTGPQQTGRRLVLCAQDPLRTTERENGITVGTPFGIDDPRLRGQKRSYGVVWNLIKRCVANGYDVWITDANKLWLKQGPKPPRFEAVMRSVLSDELARANPVGVVAMGGEAAHSLATLTQHSDVPAPKWSMTKLYHPSLRGLSRKIDPQGTAEDTAEARFAAKIDYYWNAIERSFG